MSTVSPDFVFLRRLFLVTSGLLLVLSALNLTTSSIGLHVAGDQPSTASVIIGEFRPIRSDEWNRGTPVILGSFLDSWTSDSLTPFEERDVRFGWIGEVVLPALVNPERALVGLLPSRIGFFMFLWIPPLLAVAAVAAMLRLAGVGRTTSVAGGIATSLGAASAWWSYHGSQLVWPVALATALLLISWSIDREGFRHPTIGAFRLRTDLLLATVSGLLLARYPLLYAPWSIPTVLIFGALIIDFWRSDGCRRRSLAQSAVAALVAVLVAGLSVVSQMPRLSALASTSYPAARRFVGGSEGMPLFTGAYAYYSQTDRGSVVNGSNLSESAVGPVVLVVIALLLVWLVHVGRSAHRTEMRFGVTASTIGVLLLWAFTEWPSFAVQFNPLSVIPGYRITQIIGVIALPFVWLVMARCVNGLRTSRRGALALGVGLVVLTISAADGSRYRQLFPLVTANETWFMAALLALTTAYFLWRPERSMAAIPLAAFIFISAAWVNPLVRGVGDLYDSATAVRLREVISSSKGRVASDQIGLDALLIANGIPTLGGQLNWGPDSEAWAKLDPSGEHRGAWNRAASSLQFQWSASPSTTAISAPYPDVVMVESDPCNPVFAEWDVTWIVSSQPLEAACLEESIQFTWGSLPRWLYAVN